MHLLRGLLKLVSEQIMRKDRLVITPSTTITDAAKMMEQHRVLSRRAGHVSPE
jgi:CBS domain-containing protein